MSTEKRLGSMDSWMAVIAVLETCIKKAIEHYTDPTVKYPTEVWTITTEGYLLHDNATIKIQSSTNGAYLSVATEGMMTSWDLAMSNPLDIVVRDNEDGISIAEMEDRNNSRNCCEVKGYLHKATWVYTTE